MISAEDVSAVLVTRGDVDLSEILYSLPFTDVVVWNNAQRLDTKVYGRYLAIEEVENGVVYVQDDDVVLAPEAFETLLDAYESGVLVANMPEIFRHSFYVEHCLVGFGAIFDAGLPEEAFLEFDSYFSQHFRRGESFLRTCDIVFTTLAERKLVDVSYRELPWHHADTRMYRQEDHVASRMQMLEAAIAVRDRRG